ncbi:MAG: glutamate 5-kinase [Planctomycetota bacterium]|nr:glutamate 5-kinase [Planctomycetota bacterium]
MPRKALQSAKTLVVKVGSSLLASLSGGLDTVFVAKLAGQIASLRDHNRTVILVSSGAVAAGTSELGLPRRPCDLPGIQAAAAVGQVALMQIYRQLFNYYHINVAQILLTRDNLRDRRRFLHARNALLALLKAEVLPVINENDAVAVEELRLKMGDNDSLAVSTAQLVDADAIIMMTDVLGLFDRHPSDPDAALIPEVREVTGDIMRMAGPSASGVGSGGMTSKLNAARAAGAANIPLLLVHGKMEDVLVRAVRGVEVGTVFMPPGKRESSYRQWVAYGRGPDGVVVVDDGAKAALTTMKKSLLPIGIREVRGDFQEGDTIAIFDLEGGEIARGLSNFTASDMRKIAGKRSNELSVLLDRHCDETAVHRDNLVMVG